jgi:hypothetical protein
VKTISSRSSRPGFEALSSRTSRFVAFGFTMSALGFVAILTTNGTSGGIFSEVLSITAASLLAMGFLIPASGMFLFGRNLGERARRSFFLQGSGMAILFLGVIIVGLSSSLTGYLMGSIFLGPSVGLSLTGAILFRRFCGTNFAALQGGANYFVLAIVLIFSGMGLIVGANIAFYYVLSQVESTVYSDVGATISAYGCVLAAYSFFILYHASREAFTHS